MRISLLLRSKTVYKQYIHHAYITVKNGNMDVIDDMSVTYPDIYKKVRDMAVELDDKDVIESMEYRVRDDSK